VQDVIFISSRSKIIPVYGKVVIHDEFLSIDGKTKNGERVRIKNAILNFNIFPYIFSMKFLFFKRRVFLVRVVQYAHDNETRYVVLPLADDEKKIAKILRSFASSETPHRERLLTYIIQETENIKRQYQDMIASMIAYMSKKDQMNAVRMLEIAQNYFNAITNLVQGITNANLSITDIAPLMHPQMIQQGEPIQVFPGTEMEAEDGTEYSFSQKRKYEKRGESQGESQKLGTVSDEGLLKVYNINKEALTKLADTMFMGDDDKVKEVLATEYHVKPEDLERVFNIVVNKLIG